MSAADAVSHLHLGQVEILSSSAEVLACHGVLDEGGVGDIGGWKPESHFGSDGFFLVGRL